MQKTNISSSALYKYLGWTKSRRAGTEATGGVYKKRCAIITLSGYVQELFANTQEDKFYMISNVGSKTDNQSQFRRSAIGRLQITYNRTKYNTKKTRIR